MCFLALPSACVQAGRMPPPSMRSGFPMQLVDIPRHMLRPYLRADEFKVRRAARLMATITPEAKNGQLGLLAASLTCLPLMWGPGMTRGRTIDRGRAAGRRGPCICVCIMHPAPPRDALCCLSLPPPCRRTVPGWPAWRPSSHTTLQSTRASWQTWRSCAARWGEVTWRAACPALRPALLQGPRLHAHPSQARPRSSQHAAARPVCCLWEFPPGRGLGGYIFVYHGRPGQLGRV